MTASGYKIELTSDAHDELAKEGFDPNYGARPLKRAIQRMLEDPLSEEMLKGKFKKDKKIYVDWDGAAKKMVFLSKPVPSKTKA